MLSSDTFMASDADFNAPASRRGTADAEPDSHDRSLILERLRWTPEQRLDANTAFLRFYFSVRPDGPLVSD
jgi:hypothetical protein